MPHTPHTRHMLQMQSKLQTVSAQREPYLRPTLEPQGSWRAITGISVCFGCGPSFQHFQDMQNNKDAQ